MNFSIKNKYVRAGIHVAAWGVFLALLSTLVPRPQIKNSVLPVLIPFLFFVSFFYFNFYILVPRLFFPKKYIAYLLFCVTCLILTIAVPSLITGLSRPKLPFPQQSNAPGPGKWPGPGPVMEPGNSRGILPEPGNPGSGQPGRRRFPSPPPKKLDFFRPEFSY